MRKERQSKYEIHGRIRTGVYMTWNTMIQRCTNPKYTYYHCYGGRGIKVCDKWLYSFVAFLADVGERPTGMTLDRYPNKDGNYEPGNVRWATKYEQSQNTRQTRLLEFNGLKMGVTAWCRHLGLTPGNLNHRLNSGWSIEEALSRPKLKPGETRAALRSREPQS